jgi:CarD family transcriptional regulator
MYKINDVVVFRRDVCKIVAKHKSDFTGEQCYILVPYYNQDGSVRMQVPVANKGGHLRDLITKQQIEDLIQNTPDIETLENKPANMKSQYAALLKTDELSDLVRIIKTSYGRNKTRLEQHKKLASIDDEYLQKAEKYLYDEISVALNMSFDESKQFFEDEVEKAKKN